MNDTLNMSKSDYDQEILNNIIAYFIIDCMMNSFEFENYYDIKHDSIGNERIIDTQQKQTRSLPN